VLRDSEGTRPARLTLTIGQGFIRWTLSCPWASFRSTPVCRPNGLGPTSGSALAQLARL
jgi:hypothetical protein